MVVAYQALLYPLLVPFASLFSIFSQGLGSFYLHGLLHKLCQTLTGRAQHMSETMENYGGIAGYLAEHLGREVIAEFQCGADETVRKAGTLTAVQPGYMVLRDDMSLRDTVCALEHLCFVTFYLSGTLPRSDAPAENRSGSGGGAAPAAAQSAVRTPLAALNTVRNSRRGE